MDSFLAQYNIQFDRAITHPCIAPIFRRHLLRFMNDNEAEFIEAVARFRNLKDDGARYAKGRDIITQHIEDDSPRTINLPSNLFDSTRQEFSKCTEDCCPPQTFDKPWKCKLRYACVP